jgi:hypothetical protein
MKKLRLVLALAILLAGGVASTSALAQGYAPYNYPPPPPNPYAAPWVGPGTPWVFYGGDWFLNGVPQFFFGVECGWAPYNAYPPACIVREDYWYGPRWGAWYQGNPYYRDNFVPVYPY